MKRHSRPLDLSREQHGALKLARDAQRAAERELFEAAQARLDTEPA